MNVPAPRLQRIVVQNDLSVAWLKSHFFSLAARANVFAGPPDLDALRNDAYTVLAYVFFAIILLHVAAALFHALIRRDGVFRAMAGIGPRE